MRPIDVVVIYTPGGRDRTAVSAWCRVVRERLLFNPVPRTEYSSLPRLGLVCVADTYLVLEGQVKDAESDSLLVSAREPTVKEVLDAGLPSNVLMTS